MRFYLACILMTCAYAMTYAKQFTVRSASNNNDSIKIVGFERMIRDLTASTKQVADINGVPCGVIKVNVNDSAYIFQPNFGVIKEITEVGERILYVPAGTKSISVRHPQYVMLRNYMLPTPVESKATYLLTIDVKELEHTTDVELLSNVDGADVYVDDIIVGVTPFRGRLPSGQHEVILRANRYQPAGKQLQIQGEHVKFIFTLQENKHFKYKSKYQMEESK